MDIGGDEAVEGSSEGQLQGEVTPRDGAQRLAKQCGCPAGQAKGNGTKIIPAGDRSPG